MVMAMTINSRIKMCGPECSALETWRAAAENLSKLDLGLLNLAQRKGSFFHPTGYYCCRSCPGRARQRGISLSMEIQMCRLRKTLLPDSSA